MEGGFWRSFDWRSEVLVLLLRVKSKWGATIPSPKPIIPKTHPIKIFKRTILFRTVERSSDCVFGDVSLPTVLRAIFFLFTCGICYWEKYACLNFTFQNDKRHSGDPFRECWVEHWTKIKTCYAYIDCQRSITWEWLSILINFQEMIREMIKRQYFHASTTTTTTTTTTATTLLHLKYWMDIWNKWKEGYIYLHCQKSVSWELIWVLN